MLAMPLDTSARIAKDTIPNNADGDECCTTGIQRARGGESLARRNAA
jgi:hypothetical protein